MRVVVTGATGNLGTSVVQALSTDPAVSSVLGLARRPSGWAPANTEMISADITRTDLVPLFRGAAAVVHLAWLIQPARRSAVTWETNAIGSSRVFRAAAEAGVPAVVYASSVGAYSPAPKDRTVDESWPTHGWPSAAYGREKAYVERLLDSFELEHPQCRVIRFRPGFIFKRESASGQRRTFAGPLLPASLARPGLIPFIPAFPSLKFQAVHAADAAEAFRLAVTGSASGAFNIAADPVLDAAELARVLRAPALPVPPGVLRAGIAAAWHGHLVPIDPNLFDAFLRMPVLSCERARTELGWSPRHSAVDAVRELLAGLQAGAGLDTPPLAATARQSWRATAQRLARR
jgi:UDP-glucose 4-epimerase